MAINPVSASNAAVNSTQAVRPAQEAYKAQHVSGEVKNDNESENATVYQAGPKQTVNTNGQTIGTTINITA